jgi:hypothetical protein
MSNVRELTEDAVVKIMEGYGNMVADEGLVFNAPW